MTHNALGNSMQAAEFLDKANARAHQEINDKQRRISWYRKTAFEILRQEAESLIFSTHDDGAIEPQCASPE
jgi:hypothetical protein